MTTPRHLEANALSKIAALREAHPFEIVAKRPRELPLSLANLVERCGLTVSSDVDQLTEEDGFLIRLMDPSERAVMDAGNSGSRDDNEAWQGRCRIVFLYQTGEEEIAQRVI